MSVVPSNVEVTFVPLESDARLFDPLGPLVVERASTPEDLSEIVALSTSRSLDDLGSLLFFLESPRKDETGLLLEPVTETLGVAIDQIHAISSEAALKVYVSVGPALNPAEPCHSVPAAISCSAFDKQGRLVVACGQGSVFRMMIESSAPYETLPQISGSACSSLLPLSAGSDLRLLGLCFDGTARWIGSDSKNEIFQVSSSSILTGYSADNRSIVFGTSNGRIHVRAIEADHVLKSSSGAEFKCEFSSFVTGLTPLDSAKTGAVSFAGELAVCDTASGSSVYEKFLNRPALSLGTTGESTLCVGLASGGLRLIDCRTPQNESTVVDAESLTADTSLRSRSSKYVGSKDVSGVTFLLPGRAVQREFYLAAGFASGALKLFDTRAMQTPVSFVEPFKSAQGQKLGGGCAVTSMHWLTSDRFVVGASNQIVATRSDGSVVKHVVS